MDTSHILTSAHSTEQQPLKVRHRQERHADQRDSTESPEHKHTQTADGHAEGARNTHGERTVSATNDARKLKLNLEDNELGSYCTPQTHDNSVN